MIRRTFILIFIKSKWRLKQTEVRVALSKIKLNLTTVGQKYIQFVLFQVIFISFFVFPAIKKLTRDHQEIKDVAYLCSNELHKKCVEAPNKQKNLNSFLKPSDSATQLDQQVINAEVIIINFLVQQNLPLATSNHLGSLVF